MISAHSTPVDILFDVALSFASVVVIFFFAILFFAILAEALAFCQRRFSDQPAQEQVDTQPTPTPKLVVSKATQTEAEEKEDLGAQNRELRVANGLLRESLNCSRGETRVARDMYMALLREAIVARGLGESSAGNDDGSGGANDPRTRIGMGTGTGNGGEVGWVSV